MNIPYSILPFPFIVTALETASFVLILWKVENPTVYTSDGCGSEWTGQAASD
jgi:hypothetical protein